MGELFRMYYGTMSITMYFKIYLVVVIAYIIFAVFTRHKYDYLKGVILRSINFMIWMFFLNFMLGSKSFSGWITEIKYYNPLERMNIFEWMMVGFFVINAFKIELYDLFNKVKEKTSKFTIYATILLICPIVIFLLNINVQRIKIEEKRTPYKQDVVVDEFDKYLDEKYKENNFIMHKYGMGKKGSHIFYFDGEDRGLMFVVSKDEEGIHDNYDAEVFDERKKLIDVADKVRSDSILNKYIEYKPKGIESKVTRSYGVTDGSLEMYVTIDDEFNKQIELKKDYEIFKEYKKLDILNKYPTIKVRSEDVKFKIKYFKDEDDYIKNRYRDKPAEYFSLAFYGDVFWDNTDKKIFEYNIPIKKFENINSYKEFLDNIEEVTN